MNGAAEREEMLSVLLSLRKSSMFDFEGTNSAEMAQWLSWLERRPVTAKVVGSSPIWVVTIKLLIVPQVGVLAQLGEHLPYKQRVIGSSPIGPTYYSKIDSMPMWLNWQSS